jgi:hypothetical protein
MAFAAVCRARRAAEQNSAYSAVGRALGSAIGTGGEAAWVVRRNDERAAPEARRRPAEAARNALTRRRRMVDYVVRVGRPSADRQPEPGA